MIVVGVDLWPPSRDAARSAARLARKLGDELLLVRVIEPVAALYPELALAANLEAPVRKAAAEGLATLRDSLSAEGITVTTRILSGQPAHVLAAVAREEHARLLVVGTQGRGAVADLFLGSVAQRTTTEAPCPVLVLQAGAAPFDEWVAGARSLRLVVGVDRSRATQAALAWVGQLRAAGPCDVVLVHEYWPPGEYTRLGLRGPRALEEADPEVVSTIERELRAHLGDLPGAGQVALRVHASWERLGESLAHEAQAERADLVVVGSQQAHGWQRFRRGSAARSTLHAARIPVLCVPEQVVPAAEAGSGARIPVIRSVLVATDLSALGNAAVVQAYALLRAGGGVVELCHVHERHLPSPVYAFDAREGALPAERRARLEQELRALVPAEAGQHGITSNVTVIDGGGAAEQILQAARRFGADVIVVASHGRSGVARALLGSVAESIVRGSERPVHVVRGEREA